MNCRDLWYEQWCISDSARNALGQAGLLLQPRIGYPQASVPQVAEIGPNLTLLRQTVRDATQDSLYAVGLWIFDTNPDYRYPKTTGGFAKAYRDSTKPGQPSPFRDFLYSRLQFSTTDTAIAIFFDSSCRNLKLHLPRKCLPELKLLVWESNYRTPRVFDWNELSGWQAFATRPDIVEVWLPYPLWFERTANPNGCSLPSLDAARWPGAVQSIKNNRLASTRMEAAKGLAQNNCLTAYQIGELLEIFDAETDRLDIAKFCFRYCSDTWNYYMLYPLFSINSNIESLSKFVHEQTVGP